MQIIPLEYILVTGGAGYIGSHTVLECIQAGLNVIVYDNLSNSSEESLNRIESITGIKPVFIKGCINDTETLNNVFKNYSIHSVLHFAGLKSVSESIKYPKRYHTINTIGTSNLLKVMLTHNVYNIVFSSSATVYGVPQFLPLTESHPLNPINPYGQSKLDAEQVIQEFCDNEPRLNACLLRYFNPVGSHSSGIMGEDPNGIPSNLVPFLSQVLVGKLPYAQVYGSDYDTHDGTGVRDYIHVVDLALGHLAALNSIRDSDKGCVIYNMGSGRGYSVLEMIDAMQRVSGMELPYKVVERREGDAGFVVADPSLANLELGWKTERHLIEMCGDSWRWQSNNPHGYQSGRRKSSIFLNRVDSF